jgi:hypothetical protein
MNRRHFKKNPDQVDIFDIATQLDDVKKLADTQEELLMLDKLSDFEYQNYKEKQMPDIKKKIIKSVWYQVSIESIFEH